MATDETNAAFFEPTQTPAEPELLVSAVLHLMSHYTANTNETTACLKLACVIERHLKALAALPGLAPVLRATCQQLSEQWAAIVERAMPKKASVSLFSRLASGGKASH
jgi:hypothetical protein